MILKAFMARRAAAGRGWGGSDMPQCITPDQMTYFLNLTGLRFEMAENVLTLFATAGSVQWLWNGAAFCIGTGVGA